MTAGSTLPAAVAVLVRIIGLVCQGPVTVP